MNIRIFYAHSSFDSIDRVEEACKRIQEVFRAKGERAGKEMKISIVSGREDFRVHCRGDWGTWTKGVIKREHSITRKPYYDMIVIPTPYVGRATAQIVGTAIRFGRPVFLLCEHSDKNDAPPIQRITQVYAYDEDDWQGGFRCDPDPQLKLPFKENNNENPNS